MHFLKIIFLIDLILFRYLIYDIRISAVYQVEFKDSSYQGTWNKECAQEQVVILIVQ